MTLKKSELYISLQQSCDEMVKLLVDIVKTSKRANHAQ